MNKSVAVAIVHHRSPDTPDEQLSLRHAERYFRDYDVFAVCPSDVRLGKYPRIVFDDNYFSDLPNHNLLRLMLSFYEQFSRYDYLLIYELDSLVFSDNLAEFCTENTDYIGAPWIHYENDIPVGMSAVGNSGFSLRRVEACMKVLMSNVRIMQPLEYWQKIGCHKKGLAKAVGVLGLTSKVLKYRNDINWFVRQFIHSPYRTWSPNEDKFWSVYAVRFYPDFHIASIDQALKFSFEHAPEYCFMKNGQQLPLGCHAWRKHGESFWKPYLLD